MKSILNKVVAGWLVSNGLFFYIYVLMLSGGYDNARSMCETKYNFQYVTNVTMFPTCILLKRVE